MPTMPFMQRIVYNPHRPGFLNISTWNLRGMGCWPIAKWYDGIEQIT